MNTFGSKEIYRKHGEPIAAVWRKGDKHSHFRGPCAHGFGKICERNLAGEESIAVVTISEAREYAQKEGASGVLRFPRVTPADERE